MRGMSLNMAGLNNPLKRSCIYLIKKENSNIICLQETHLRAQEEKYLKDIFQGQIFHTLASVKKRGVCIGILKRVDW